MNETLKISKTVIHERLDGEVVILDMATGRYFSLSGPAADLWYLISNAVPISRWEIHLAEVYPNTSRFTGLNYFVEEVAKHGLAEKTESQHSDANPVFPLDYKRGNWVPPEIFSYDDLTDLLLIDPVHDAGENY